MKRPDRSQYLRLRRGAIATPGIAGTIACLFGDRSLPDDRNERADAGRYGKTHTGAAANRIRSGGIPASLPPTR